MSVGGQGVMLLGALAAGVVCVLGALALRARVGDEVAWPAAGLVWSLAVIVVVTLVPASGPPGVIPAGEAQTSCSFDLGGPAPEGFWLLGGGQRLLNTVLFVPAGFFLALLLARRRRWALLLPGLALAACSAGIEWVQLGLARLDRACEVTDVVDNVGGAVLGVAAGLLAAALLGLVRPRGTATRRPR